MAINSSGKNLSIKTFITKPEAKYHLIEDNELENIMKISCPISLLICTTSLGYLLGEARTIFDFIEKIRASYRVPNPIVFELGMADALYLCLIAISVALALATGIYAATGKSEISKTLEKIRSRPPVQIK